MKLWILFLILSISSHSLAQRKSRPVDELTRHRQEVTQMGARLSTLEKEIATKSDLRNSNVEQIKKFEEDVALYKEQLLKLQRKLRVTEKENKQIVTNYLLESESEESPLWQKKIHLQLLRQAQDKLKFEQGELQSFADKVASFEIKLEQLRKEEESLELVLNDLENTKKEVAAKYQVANQKKEELEKKVQEDKVRVKLSAIKKRFNTAPLHLKKAERIFNKPIDQFIAITPSAKGVTFKYDSIQPVKAVADGKVMHAGDLASYGQVILIDHGNDLRTVFLGKMNIRVKKNDSVKVNDILGYTYKDSTPQNLYFEVRKKNTAQNTILWLEGQGVSKI
ncbi:MAG TPA: peptidoglycan DD-metalloendopeptidase family protein [Bacteriovoracaceae bacterium]|nr:peptidoglycan DD-metalloendopeptidase family protein [Bacteriovoracaceae bacterium]